MTLRLRAARPTRPTQAARTVLLSLLVAAVMAACGSTATQTPSSSTGPATPVPQATNWPITTVEAVIALAAGDPELWKAGADIAKAADAGDPEAMWGAADGTVKLIEGLMPNIEALERYPHTAELGALYRASFPVMVEGATQIRDSITAGDADGVVAGSKRLSEGVVLYAEVRKVLQGYLNEALTMKKNLVQ